ncbi:MAG: hypothetical protein NVSMB1_01630 [Polyangiales bacterium]
MQLFAPLTKCPKFPPYTPANRTAVLCAFKCNRGASRGLTLIELMAVVAIIGVVAALAIVGYGRWIGAARIAEATHMIEGIRGAQETYKTETGGYLDVSKGINPGFLYPAATPGDFKTKWGATCSVCKSSWRSLSFAADAQVRFGYATVADNTGSCNPACRGYNVAINGAAVNFPSLNGGPIVKPWYLVVAHADNNGNGVFSTVLGDSFNAEILVDSATENE